jgi:hypothetical protein
MRRTLAISMMTIVLAGCGDSNKSPAPTQPSKAPEPPKIELNAQGLLFAKVAYINDFETVVLNPAGAGLDPAEAMRLLKIDMVVSAESYAKDYDDNEISADQKYKGKKLLVSGKIESINKDITNNGYISLDGHKPFYGLQARLTKAGMESAAALKKRQVVYLVCDSGMKVATITTVRNCERYSRHLESMRPELENNVEQFLSGKSAMPKAIGESMAALYIVGVDLPKDSPCLRNVDECDAEFDRMAKDKDRQKATAAKTEELMKRLKLL